MQPKRILQVLGLALIILLFVGADDNQRFDKLGHRMMCQCGCNQVLLECNHVGCTVSEQMRGELKLAMAGVQMPGGPSSSSPSGPQSRGTAAPPSIGASPSDETVLQAFVTKYGPVVLAAPTTSGFNRVAWIMPYLALVLGFGFVAVIVRKWQAHQQPASASAAAAGSTSTDPLDDFRRRARQETEL
jgi:cytochrome c-type biogenesis protein CcmH/NrfF